MNEQPPGSRATCNSAPERRALRDSQVVRIFSAMSLPLTQATAVQPMTAGAVFDRSSSLLGRVLIVHSSRNVSV